ncbi:MAG: hypothetical protein ABII23_01055 [bacterium]
MLPVSVIAAERWIDLDAELRTEWIAHKLQDGWKSIDAGDPQGVNKDFSYTRGVSTATPSGWRGEIEEVFLVNLAAQPSEKLSFDLGYEFLGNYAGRLWQPISDRKRMELSGNKNKWVRGNILYKGKMIRLQGFKGVGHASWLDTDIDMFNFYPEQFEEARYRRVSGRILPRGGSVELGNNTTGRLTYITGKELVWGYGPSHYAKYNKRVGKTQTSLFYKREEISYGRPDEKLNSWQIVEQVYLLKRTKLNIGLLYQPFRVGETYEHIEDVAPGAGLLGSEYRVKTDIIDAYDAWGEAIELIVHPKPVLDSVTVGYKHMGLVAGNKDEASIKGKRSFFSKQVTSSFGFTRIKPIQDPLPLLTDPVGSILVSPRGKDSPFRVTEDPQLGDEWGNREKNMVDFVTIYDPTPITWFFKWKENIVEEWNINPAENAHYAAAFQLRFIEYPGTTDNVPYFNEPGDITFVPAHLTGMPPSRGYLPSAKLMSILNLPRKYMLIIGLGGGQMPASTVLADEKGKNFTNFLTSQISCRKGHASLSLTYERDTWGPEDFHRDFGEIIDRLFKTSAGYEFGDAAYINAEYLFARRIENLTDTFSLGSFDEFRLLLGFKFGALILPDQRGQAAAYQQEEKAPVFQTKLLIDDYVFSPDGDGIDDTITIHLEVIAGGIDSWQVTIIDDTQRNTAVFSGRGSPPAYVIWDGIDKDFDATVGEGTYTVNFQVNDTSSHSTFAAPMEIKVQY